MKNFLLKIYNKIIQSIEKIKKARARKVYSKLQKPQIMSTKDTIHYIIKHKVSVSRFGDGEFSLVAGKCISFQSVNGCLVDKLRKILVADTPNHITCLPITMVSTKSVNEKASQYWKTYFEENYSTIVKYLRLDKVYYDALITRLYIDNIDKNEAAEHFELLKEIWLNKDICIIEGEKSRLGVGNDLFNGAQSITRIICPSINAFNAYNDILSFVNDNVTKDKLLLIALGPTATALAWDLSKMGYWALDIGHVDIEYEWMLMGAEKKVPIKNKFVGDLFTFDEADDSTLDSYTKSIIKVLN